nr:ATP-binding protein [Moritella viscosa]SHO17738.1 Putative uncharacterized protein [Moritella viscosa]
MITDVEGKVRNLKLKPSERLIPLFEAIINSIQASAEKANIEVDVYRQQSQITLDIESDKYQDIESFRITDYGVGFNKSNFESFQTADSTFKSSLGCKGVGRFTWLKAFESIEVESCYFDNEEFKKRNFIFSIKNDDFDDAGELNVTGDNPTPVTKVTLKNVKAPYQEKMPLHLDCYAREIIEHCITYFLDNKIERFIIKDNVGGEIDVLDYFNINYSSDIIHSDFDVQNHRFKSFYVKTYNKQKKHKIFFCANSRTVKEYNPASYIPNIPDHFLDESLIKFRYSVYVSSEYLNDNVNQERTSFSISEKEDYLEDDRPAIETIIGELIIQCDGVFSEYLKPMLETHIERVTEYVNNIGYEYRTILKHKPDWIKKLKFGLTDDELDVELHKLFRDFEVELKSNASKIKHNLKESKVISSGEYKEAYEQYTSALNDVGKSNLAKYVIHRKSIIDILELSLDIQENDKYALESAVHDIIFPLNATSDDTNGLSQNLWLIDERMSYHNLLSSDKPFNKVSDIDDKQRPDILLFNNPIAFADDDKKPSTATIIEFKRPMRDDYTDSDNPIKQVIGYVKKLREPNKIKNNKGRYIHLAENIPIYCYIVCDMTRKIREFANDNNYIVTPDNEGYLWHHNRYNAYFELISFDKLVWDAKKRNKVLFKSLNIE